MSEVNGPLYSRQCTCGERAIPLILHVNGGATIPLKNPDVLTMTLNLKSGEHQAFMVMRNGKRWIGVFAPVEGKRSFFGLLRSHWKNLYDIRIDFRIRNLKGKDYFLKTTARKGASNETP